MTTLPIVMTTLFVTLFAFSIVWLFSLRLNDVGIVDYYWGLGFAVIAWLSLWMKGESGTVPLVLAGLVTLWSLRLTAHLVARHRLSRGEDARYAAMRARGGPNFKRNSLAMIFWLQAFVLWLVASPVHAAMLAPASGPVDAIFAVGILLFAAGFMIEAVADWQIACFKANPLNAGRLLTGGLFAWCRHPNYFGEALLWWGFALASYTTTGMAAVFFGPALLTFLLLKVSGIPMLEAQLRDRPGYGAWVARTPAFFPAPPRRDQGKTVNPLP